MPDLVRLVRLELQQYREQEPARAEARKLELEQAQRQLAGWALTLGDPDLSTVVRRDIVQGYDQVKLRVQELEQAAEMELALEKHVDSLIDETVVLAELDELAEVLAGNNPTLGNLKLSKHIDCIYCHPDGRIEMRGTFLGLFDGAAELIDRSEPKTPSADQIGPTNGSGQVIPRRRGRLRIPTLAAESAIAASELETSLDPERFRGLPEHFFWTETFELPKKLCWSEEYAIRVAELRFTKNMTVEALAKHFGKTAPTILKALRRAMSIDERFVDRPRKMSRRRWAVDHALEVALHNAKGMSIDDLAVKFMKSDTTIRSALEHAKRLSASEGVSILSDMAAAPNGTDAPNASDD